MLSANLKKNSLDLTLKAARLHVQYYVMPRGAEKISTVPEEATLLNSGMCNFTNETNSGYKSIIPDAWGNTSKANFGL